MSNIAGNRSDYEALEVGPALVDRSYRSLLEVTGVDRAAWLHNLTTNQVKNLGRGEGNYAFVLNVQGRILFDVNVLVRDESIWVDLDRRFLETARKHFAKYIITEDVAVVDRSDEFVRVALVGREAVSRLAELGAPNAAAMAQLNHLTLELPVADLSRGREPAVTDQSRERQQAVNERVGQDRSTSVAVLMVRHDFCGPFGVELIVPQHIAIDFRTALCDGIGGVQAIPVGEEAVQVHRIEAVIPWPGHEITDEYLPAETRQLARAVSFQKGCYLGQEVVERMRSRAVVARQLVGVRIEGTSVPPTAAEFLDHDGKPVGKVTSACRSMATGGVIALAYVRTASSAVGTSLRLTWDGGGAGAVVVDLPFTSAAAR